MVLLNNPTQIKIDGKLYKINTDFRIALECNRIARDETIGDYERALAIIYSLFGEEGINSKEHHNKLLEVAKKHILCGDEYIDKNGEPDMY